VDKFPKGQSNFEIVFAYQKCVFGKAGLGFDPNSKNRSVSKPFSSFFEKQLFLPLGLGHLRTSLRASLHERLCFYSNIVLPLLLTPETERQMGALAAICAPTLKSAMAENTVTLPVAEHHQLSAQRSA